MNLDLFLLALLPAVFLAYAGSIAFGQEVKLTPAGITASLNPWVNWAIWRIQLIFYSKHWENTCFYVSLGSNPTIPKRPFGRNVLPFIRNCEKIKLIRNYRLQKLRRRKLRRQKEMKPPQQKFHPVVKDQPMLLKIQNKLQRPTHPKRIRQKTKMNQQLRCPIQVRCPFQVQILPCLQRMHPLSKPDRESSWMFQTQIWSMIPCLLHQQTH